MLLLGRGGEGGHQQDLGQDGAALLQEHRDEIRQTFWHCVNEIEI